MGLLAYIIVYSKIRLLIGHNKNKLSKSSDRSLTTAYLETRPTLISPKNKKGLTKKNLSGPSKKLFEFKSDFRNCLLI